jgi:hypothetical protein
VLLQCIVYTLSCTLVSWLQCCYSA